MSGELYIDTGFRPVLRHMSRDKHDKVKELGIGLYDQGMPAPVEDHFWRAAVWLGTRVIGEELPVLAVTIPKTLV